MYTRVDARAVERLSRFLLDEEQVLYCQRQHGLSVLTEAWQRKKWLGVLLGTALLAWVLLSREGWALGVALLLAVVAYGVFISLEWAERRFVITDKRVMLVLEPLPVNVTFIALSRVTNVTFDQGLFGRLFKYGTFGIDNAGDRHPLHSLPYTRFTGELYDILSDQLLSDSRPPRPDPDAPHHTRPLT